MDLSPVCTCNYSTSIRTGPSLVGEGGGGVEGLRDGRKGVDMSPV